LPETAGRRITIHGESAQRPAKHQLEHLNQPEPGYPSGRHQPVATSWLPPENRSVKLAKLMKKTLIVIALAAVCGVCARADNSTLLATNTAQTTSTRTTSIGDMGGRFGAGVIVGEPIGASVKYFFNDAVAIDGALGWSLHDHTDIYMHSDVLWHNYDLIPVSQGRLPVYFGAGGLLRLRNSGEDDQFGIRVPVGVSYLFDNAPVDIFAEIGPALDLTPSLRGEITGGVGIRFWF
jgi:hypothetical protein